MNWDQPKAFEPAEESEDSPKDNRPIGPLSDRYEEGGPKTYGEAEASEILNSINQPRNPEDPIEVASEKEKIGEKLEQVNRLITEKADNDPRKVSELETARDKLEDDLEKVEMAEEYNEVLEKFNGYSDEELEHIEKTGKKLNGEKVLGKGGKEIHSDIAKKLAGMSLHGLDRVTWGNLDTLQEIADVILKDVISTAKRMVGLGGKEA